MMRLIVRNVGTILESEMIEWIVALDREWQDWADELKIWEEGGTFWDMIRAINPNNLMCKYQGFDCTTCSLMESTCSDNKGATLHPALSRYNDAINAEPEDVPTIITSIRELLELLDDLRNYPHGKVVGSNGDIGVGTGAKHQCRMEGCTGLRITTRWADGSITHPCTKGMYYTTNTWTIW